MSVNMVDVLLANSIIEPRIKTLETKVDGITNPFEAIGRVDTVADLANVQNPQVGWVYLVGLENDPNKAEYWYTSSYTWEYLGQQIVVDSTPTQSSNNPVSSGGVYTALSDKQDTLTFDSIPTENSNNPVKSGGVYTAIAGKSSVTISNSGDITIDGQLVRKVLTQAEYDLLDPPDPKVEYLIIPAAQANQGE